jgi:hypothetical protein
VTHKSDRVCLAKAVEVRAGEVFAIEERDLTDCSADSLRQPET